jgi:hypothetical protein
VRTAEEWQGTDDVTRMRRCVGSGGRKVALLLAACLRSRPAEPDRALAALEAFADGSADTAGRWVVEAVTVPAFGPAAAIRPVLDLCRGDGNGFAALADTVRDLFGNPFLPVTPDPAWQTSTVLALAGGAYESRDFTALPILADALQDAGCDKASGMRRSPRDWASGGRGGRGG